jgi:hypothetical protein
MSINTDMSEQITRIAVYSLIDITATGAKSKSNNQLERNQQRNWETVYQIIGLRTQVAVEVFPTDPKLVNLESHNFGSYYSGYHKCWKFIFTVEPTDLYGDHNDPDRILRQDFDNIPIITGLTESAALIDPIIYTDGILKNIYFRISKQKE